MTHDNKYSFELSLHFKDLYKVNKEVKRGYEQLKMIYIWGNSAQTESP